MTMENQVGGFSTEMVVTPTISSGAIYAASDQVGGIQTLAYLDTGGGKIIDAPCQDQYTCTFLASVCLVDKSNQNAALTIFFFNALPTVVSVDNGAINISAAEMGTKCIGHVDIEATDYQSAGGASVAILNMSRCGIALRSTTDLGPLYAVVKTSDTPTYSSTTALVFKYLFSQDLGNGRGEG